ncbi:MAG: SPOR domain-containing protein [Gammaproteobacteria bacterium]
MTISRACIWTAAVVAVGTSAAARAGDAGMDVVRLTGTAAHEQAQGVSSLQVAETIRAGSRVRTGADGHAVLQLPPVGSIAMGVDASLFVHSVEPSDLPGRAGLARLVAEYGALRISARSDQGLPPADLRINVGTMKLRVFGAEIWIERLDGKSEVCLLAGAVELQTSQGARRIDQAGDCLLDSGGSVQRLDAGSARAMAPRLARTAFPGDPTVVWAATLASAEAARDGTDWPQAAAPAIAAEPSAPTAAAAAPTALTAEAPATAEDDARGWTIVLASLPELARARQEAERLDAIGIDTQVIEAARDDGTPTYRIVTGRYDTKADAAVDIRRIRSRRGLATAWVMPIP